MSELDGMNVNERLFHLGLIDEFDKQVIAKNEKGAIAVLVQARFSDEQAQETGRAILENPKRYGY